VVVVAGSLVGEGVGKRNALVVVVVAGSSVEEEVDKRNALVEGSSVGEEAGRAYLTNAVEAVEAVEAPKTDKAY
jgi:hypothetical protein